MPEIDRHQLRELRVRAGQDQRELADAARIPRKTYRNLEYTGQACSAGRVQRIADALGVDVAVLLAAAGKPDPQSEPVPEPKRCVPPRQPSQPAKPGRPPRVVGAA